MSLYPSSVHGRDRRTDRDRQATSGEQPMEGCPPIPSSLLCHPTQRGEVVRLEWLARRASCVTTVCVHGREEGIHRPYYRADYTLGLTDSYFTAREHCRNCAVTT